jgi:iron-sulfur cluster repair protein YtfE (RIC family)
MMDNKKILSLMVQEHKTVEDLIDMFEQSIDSEYEEMRQAFTKMEWKLEKHLFMEEKAIFTMYEPEDVKQGYDMLPTVTTHHNEILNRLSMMRRAIQNGQTPTDVHAFKTFLVRHRDFEERDLYPRLEEVLTQDQKDQIIERIHELI